jgi:recombination protein RecT
MTDVAKKSIGNFLNFPQTQKFLEDNLNEKRGEFVSNLLALCEADSNLQACDPKTLMMCAMNATSLNLPLNKNLGYAYIIPYKGIPQFQIGYKGLIQLAIRTGAYETINACEVREGEIVRNKITGAIKFNGEKPESKVVGYLAYLKLNTGFTASLYMTEEQIEKHALKFSKSYSYDVANKKKSSKWSDPDVRPKMALKTVLKGLLGTYGVMTTDMITAMQTDNENESDSDSNRNITDAEIVDQADPKTKKVKI